MILLIRGSQSCQIHRDKKQNHGCQGLRGKRDEELMFNWVQRFMKNVPKMDGEGDYSIM